MRMRRRKNDRARWLLAALAPLAGGAAWWVGRTISRRRSAHYRETARLEIPEDLTAAQVEPGAVQVPVTAPQGGRKGMGQRKQVQHTARVFDTPPALSSLNPEDHRHFPWPLASVLLLILVGFTVYALLGRQPARPQVIVVPGGNVEAGRQAIQAWGCGSCHTIPGIAGAYGKVGPRLDQMAEQTYIAGMLPNTPDNLMHWIMNPQEVLPGNAMPNTGVGEEVARNMAAYLYSIR